MKILQVEWPEKSPAYVGTLAEAHKLAKTAPKAFFHELRIDEFEIDTSKAGVLDILNGEFERGDPLRTWNLTPRGGMNELKAGE